MTFPLISLFLARVFFLSPSFIPLHQMQSVKIHNLWLCVWFVVFAFFRHSLSFLLSFHAEKFPMLFFILRVNFFCVCMKNTKHPFCVYSVHECKKFINQKKCCWFGSLWVSLYLVLPNVRAVFIWFRNIYSNNAQIHKKENDTNCASKTPSLSKAKRVQIEVNHFWFMK